MPDVIVVGARCAGASLAMLLARAGHHVLLVDRASFPSDTMSSHFVWQRGAARLRHWGLLDRLAARGCVPIHEITFDVGPVQITGAGPAVDGVAEMYCPRRTVLDALLVEAAVEAGAELIEGFSVQELLWSGSRVVGVRGRTRGTRAATLQARMVVGADGLHSTVARNVRACAYRERPPLTVVYYSYWSGISDRGAAFHARPGRLILSWPTNDDLTCIYVAWLHRQFHQVRANVPENFRAALASVPELRDAVASGQQEERFVGTADLPNLYRTSTGPGWALCGDAGHHKDPSTGMGMSDAFLAAECLADAVHDGLAGRFSMDDGMAAYQARRDELTAAGFALTLSTARLAPLSAENELLYRTAAERPELAQQIFGVLGGTIPVGDVYVHAR